MFEVDNFELFLRCATDINSKNKQTSDTASRIKALRRWFDGIPNLRNQNETFVMIAKKDEVRSFLSCLISSVLVRSRMRSFERSLSEWLNALMSARSSLSWQLRKQTVRVYPERAWH